MPPVFGASSCDCGLWFPCFKTPPCFPSLSSSQRDLQWLPPDVLHSRQILRGVFLHLHPAPEQDLEGNEGDFRRLQQGKVGQTLPESSKGWHPHVCAMVPQLPVAGGCQRERSKKCCFRLFPIWKWSLGKFWEKDCSFCLSCQQGLFLGNFIQMNFFLHGINLGSLVSTAGSLGKMSPLCLCRTLAQRRTVLGDPLLSLCNINVLRWSALCCVKKNFHWN